jgi:GTPase SAR1 family protein
MKIQKNKAPKLKPCKMNCDTGLHKKLDNYELSKFMNCHATNLFIGKPGSGKTSLVVSLFQSKNVFYDVFHNIYLFQPSHSRASMEDDIFDSIENKYDELTYENLEEVMNQIKEEDPDYCNCIIFDDQTAYLKDKSIKKLLKELIYNRRHLRTSVFFLCQTYMSIEPDIRKLFSNLFIFRVSKKELEKIFEELVEESKDSVLPISKLVFREKYNFLFINTDSGRLFKNWDEIIL